MVIMVKTMENMKLDIKEIFTKIPGMIAEIEGEFLYSLACRCSKGIIVEIGSNAGRSTACLARGSKAGGKSKVISVDPHNGGGATPDPTWYDMGQDGTPDSKYYINQGASLSEFQKRMIDLDLTDIVIPVVNYSELAYIDYIHKHIYESIQSIELLFIDGDHRYAYVKKDLELWGKHLINGGHVIMHDSSYVGVRRVINEMITGSGRYTNITEEPIFNAKRI